MFIGKIIGFLATFRYWAVILILFFILACIPMVTVFNNSVQTNYLVAQAQLLFFIFVFKEAKVGFEIVFLAPGNWKTCLLFFSTILLILLSLAIDGGFARFLFYFSCLIFFVSLVGFFTVNPRVFDFTLWAKILSVFFVGAYFSFYVLGIEDVYSSITKNPPLYRNIRHFNYDLMAAIGAALIIWSFGNLRQLTLFIVILVLGVFSLWTGGRGQLIVFVIFLILINFSGLHKAAFISFFALLVAYFLVLLSGETELLFSQVKRTTDLQDLNAISSGRLSIWEGAVKEAFNNFWLGHGADSFRKYDDTFIVHPHNSIVQFLFEYGALGLFISLSFFIWTGAVCLKLVLTNKVDATLKVISAFVLSIYAYSLVDGVFYHASPFAFVVFVAAGMFEKLRKADHSRSWTGTDRSWTQIA